MRDMLKGAQPKDWDLEVDGIEPVRLREILDRFGSVNVVGEAFTVYKLGHDIDVSVPRRERKAGRGHRAFVIEGDPAMSFVTAATRRDFTINAIMQDPLPARFLSFMAWTFETGCCEPFRLRLSAKIACGFCARRSSRRALSLRSSRRRLRSVAISI